MIAPDQRRALLNAIAREIVLAPDAAVSAHAGDQSRSEVADVETVVAVLGNGAQGAGEIGLGQDGAERGGFTVAQEDLRSVGVLLERRNAEARHDGVVLTDREALLGKCNGRCEILRERQARVVLGEIDQSGRQAGYTGGECAVQRTLGRDLALRVEEHGRGRGGGCGLTRVDHAVMTGVGIMYENKTAAADTGAIGLDHR